MTDSSGFLRKIKSLWLSAWAYWTLLVFASLAVVHFLPAGYPRSAVAAPILLMAPGSLTLGAIFSMRRRPQGAAFVCYAVLLSVIWTGFASLALYVLNVRITADSMYYCLLIVSAVLANVTQARLLLGRPGRGRRAAHKREIPDPDLSDAEADDAETSAAVRGMGRYSFLAVVAGIGLLVGGLYTYEHLPQPVPTGYTWMAWTGPPITGAIATSTAGTELGFQIVHHQSDTTTFHLSAAWLGSPSRPLAKSLTLNIGPNQTFQGSLFIPSLPDGCTYRIVLALTAPRQIDPLTKEPQTWSINADVHDPNKSSKTCK